MEITINDTELYDPGILDRENPRSLVNICPEVLKEFVTAIPRDTFLWTENKLTSRAKPDFTSKCLRIQFWQEYVRAQDKLANMVFSNIIRGITHKDYFLHLAKTRPIEFAWICIPPKSYDIVQKQILEESLEKMREITQKDLVDIVIEEKTDKDGIVTKKTTRKMNTAAIAELRKTTEMLQTRVLGSLTQKMQHEHSVAPKALAEKGPGLVSINAMKDLDEAIEADVLDASPPEKGAVTHVDPTVAANAYKSPYKIEVPDIKKDSDDDCE